MNNDLPLKKEPGIFISFSSLLGFLMYLMTFTVPAIIYYSGQETLGLVVGAISFLACVAYSWLFES
jgi:hypothetical protein